ncbi:MAG: alpha/beta-type small acid-soluble spore protein [Clostridiales bacterium]|nr:alpha/beta-type small acid-soluble spore protein [Clostridiales bacterium]
MSKKETTGFDPENLTPDDQLKYEIASELGLADKVRNGGWRSLTAKESGRIGGLMARRKREKESQKALRKPKDDR